ncbi:alpha/beta-hydrolase [Aspergillus karnatakaensis]|uniref:alpha/beta-hydrolase n=1 Tax=Aspergillus karnatakaensis TaxID=1810916 RepID=UPI003CCDAA70
MPPQVQVGLVPISKPTIGKNNYQGFNPRSEILPAGWNGYDSRALDADLLVEHDVGIKVRDGCTLYCDIYRPPTSGPNERIPAIVAWSPFGKKFNGVSMLKMLPWGIGIPKGTLSGLERFEGPDPAEYCPQGYAVVNVDARGSGDSEGHVVIMGSQEAEDGYDLIEALAKMDWCSGSIGLAENSHLRIVQWFIAALRPPSLKAIAPWEAAGDLYREQFVRGGVWDSGLFDFITAHIIQGNNGLESFAEMYRRSPLQNSFWADKRANIKNINIPTYVVASYSTFVHTQGSIRGWLEVDTPHKWLRWDPHQEWFDLWADKVSRDELGAFFDKFLKGKDNGFETTPRVRMALLRYGDRDPIYPIVEDDYPIPRTQYTPFYLGPSESLSLEPPTSAGQATYFAELSKSGIERVKFQHTFAERTVLAGLPKAVLYMITPDADDMNIYVLLRKLDKTGKPLLNLNIPWKNAPIDSFDELDPKDHHNLIFYFGPWAKSMHPQYPFHPHDREEKLAKNEVVELQIRLWAMGVEYEAGESISVEVQGQYPLFKNYTEDEKLNPRGGRGSVGHHVVHFGADYPSHVILPVV